MKNKTKIINILIGIIIAVILTLVILSNNISAAEDPLSGIYSTGGMASFITYNPKTFRETDISNIFGRNNRKNGNYYGLGVRAITDPYFNESVSDIYHSSTMCMYHSQSNVQDDKFSLKIVNVVDITSASQYTMHKFTGDYTTTTYDSLTVNLTDEDKSQRLRAFAYLLYQASLYERAPDENGGWTAPGYLRADVDAEYGGKKRYASAQSEIITKLKNTINYLFSRGSNSGLKIRSIFNETGLLHETFARRKQ